VGWQADNYRSLIRNSERTKLENSLLLLIRQNHLPEPVPQFKFCPDRKWVADFAYPEQKILIECEGGLWRKNQEGQWAGAHSYPGAILRDIEKYNQAALLGYRLFRFTDYQLKDGSAIEILKKALELTTR